MGGFACILAYSRTLSKEFPVIVWICSKQMPNSGFWQKNKKKSPIRNVDFCFHATFWWNISRCVDTHYNDAFSRRMIGRMEQQTGAFSTWCWVRSCLPSSRTTHLRPPPPLLMPTDNILLPDAGSATENSGLDVDDTGDGCIFSSFTIGIFLIPFHWASCTKSEPSLISHIITTI